MFPPVYREIYLTQDLLSARGGLSRAACLCGSQTTRDLLYAILPPARNYKTIKFIAVEETHSTNTNKPEAKNPTAGRVNRVKLNAKDTALIATFAALIAVSAITPAIPVGGPVAITLQTFTVLLAGAVLGPWRGFLAVVLYILVGTLGLPIFAGGSAGLAPYFGPSVGYLVSMPFAAALTGALTTRLKSRGTPKAAVFIALSAAISTILVIYTLGIPGMAWRAELSIKEAFMLNLAFVPGDMIKAALVGVVAATVHRAFPALIVKK